MLDFYNLAYFCSSISQWLYHFLGYYIMFSLRTRTLEFWLGLLITLRKIFLLELMFDWNYFIFQSTCNCVIYLYMINNVRGTSRKNIKHNHKLGFPSHYMATEFLKKKPIDYDLHLACTKQPGLVINIHSSILQSVLKYVG